jgi:hypothetical protein
MRITTNRHFLYNLLTGNLYWLALTGQIPAAGTVILLITFQKAVNSVKTRVQIPAEASCKRKALFSD